MAGLLYDEMKERISIGRKEAGEDLYKRLQQRSLEWLQESAGEVWTDFNPHDPGVTVSDVLNYALTELDYRLRFPVEDYLSDGEEGFRPERFGLFLPERVFPVDPVTVADYRRLLTDRVDRLENVWIYPAAGKRKGWYDVLAELSPLAPACCEEEVRKEISRCFHAYRNLGEGLRRVSYVKRRPLELTGDIEVAAGADALQVVADVFWETQRFFTGSLRFRRPEERFAGGKTPDEILDGPLSLYRTVDERSLQAVATRYSVAVLFRRLAVLEGVETVRTLGFREGEKCYPDIITVENPARSFTVEIPDNREKMKLNVWSGGSRVKVDIRGLPALLYARHARYRSGRHGQAEPGAGREMPAGVYRKIYVHKSVQHDFPECYGINDWGVAPGETERRKAQAMQLKGYMLLFDEVLARGLKELEHLPDLMGMEGKVPEGNAVPVDVPGGMWEKLADTERLERAGPERERALRQKRKVLEMWERMYGEESSPDWLKEYDYYGESEADSLERRFRFFRRLPEWGRCRFRAADLTHTGAGNVPGVKAYTGTLLGWEMTEEKPVVNVFPMYNLQLVDDDRFYSRPVGLLSHDLVAEDVLRPEYMEPLVMPERSYSDADYCVLREKLSVLRYNLLFEGLFREGIRPENYCILNIPGYLDRLLVFHHTQRGEWINLGRFEDRKELEETAACLRHFLIMLNRKSETMYVVEHLYLEKDGDDFGVTVVFPGWSARMADARFREECERLVCRRLPAHLRVRFQWRGPVEMWEFERAYFGWRKALASGESGTEEAAALREVLHTQGDDYGE